MIIIGEKINATRKSVRHALLEKDERFLTELARSQVDAGADYIDVNVGTGAAIENEALDMEWLVNLLQGGIEKPLAIDSPDPAVIEAGLKAHRNGHPIINSVSAEDFKLRDIMPLAKQYDASLIALAMGPEGISQDMRGRIRACHKIAAVAQDLGISPADIFFDPLALPLSTNNSHGRITIETLKEIKRQFPGFRTTIGLSNISFGLPNRALVNRVYLLLLLSLGLDSAIIDPIDRYLMASIRTANTILQEDPYCKEYLKAYRKGLLDIDRDHDA